MKEAQRMFANTAVFQDLVVQLNDNLKRLDARMDRLETLLKYQRELTTQTTALMAKHTVIGLVHIGCVYVWMQVKNLWKKLTPKQPEAAGEQKQ